MRNDFGGRPQRTVDMHAEDYRAGRGEAKAMRIDRAIVERGRKARPAALPIQPQQVVVIFDNTCRTDIRDLGSHLPPPPLVGR